MSHKSLQEQFDLRSLLSTEEKKAQVHEAKVDLEYTQLVENSRDLNALENLNLNQPSDPLKWKQETAKARQRAERPITLFTKQLTIIAKLSSPSLTLVAGTTGQGKTTALAALAAQSIAEGKRVLICHTEEPETQLVNRIATNLCNLDINSFHSFTTTDLEALDQKRIEIAPLLTIFDKDKGGTVNPHVKTLEGVEAILKQLAANPTAYDLVIFDYIQGIDKSVRNTRMQPWEVQDRAAALFDHYFNLTPPLIVMAQLKPRGTNCQVFEERIKLGKKILQVCTFAVEIQPVPEALVTKFILQKARFGGRLGAAFYTKYVKGSLRDEATPHDVDKAEAALNPRKNRDNYGGSENGSDSRKRR
jgi:hypothetical protein